MRLHLLLAVCLILSKPLIAADQPIIAIIIDDIGYRLSDGQKAVQLPGAVTCAFLPHTPFAQLLAEKAASMGKEVMLHLPMQSTIGKRLGPGGLTVSMEEAEFKRSIKSSLDSIPYVAGVNNHMGSLLTRHPGAMNWLMGLLKTQGDLYFIDSRTAEKSVAMAAAHEHGIPVTQRDIFLDNLATEEAIRKQLRRAIAQAKQQGTAVAIGHPYPETMAVLYDELSRLDQSGVKLVSASEIIKKRRGDSIWTQSSFPLQTVAKNSKQ